MYGKRWRRWDWAAKCEGAGTQAVLKYRAIGDLDQRSEFLSLQQLLSVLQRKARNPNEKREAGLGSSPYTDEEEQEKNMRLGVLHRSRITTKAVVALKGGGQKHPRKAFPWKIMKLYVKQPIKHLRRKLNNRIFLVILPSSLCPLLLQSDLTETAQEQLDST